MEPDRFCIVREAQQTRPGEDADIALIANKTRRRFSLLVLHYSLHKSKVASIFRDEMRLGEAR